MNQEITPLFLWLPTQPLSGPCPQNAHNSVIMQIQASSHTFYSLYLENQSLRAELETIKQSISELSQENEFLNSQRTDLSVREKRRYSKRRVWLEKECEGRYSSKIALNNHLRKKHSHQADEEQSLT